MFVYNLYWNAEKSILLYPKTEKKTDGKFGEFHKGMKKVHFCKVAFVSVLNEKEELNMNIAKEILEKI